MPILERPFVRIQVQLAPHAAQPPPARVARRGWLRALCSVRALYHDRQLRSTVAISQLQFPMLLLLRAVARGGISQGPPASSLSRGLGLHACNCLRFCSCQPALPRPHCSECVSNEVVEDGVGRFFEVAGDHMEHPV